MDDTREPRALSQSQFMASGFDSSGYVPISEPGTFIGTLDMKIWGKYSNLICLITLLDGRKISCNTYPSKEYLGIDKLPVSSVLELEFALTTRGNLGLVRVSAI